MAAIAVSTYHPGDYIIRRSPTPRMAQIIAIEDDGKGVYVEDIAENCDDCKGMLMSLEELVEWERLND